MILFFRLPMASPPSDASSFIPIPPLLRQETVGPEELGAFNNGGIVNGQFVPPPFEPLVDGYWGYDMGDIEESMRNNRMFPYDNDSDNEYEREDMMAGSESDSDEEEDEDVPMLFSTCICDACNPPSIE